MNPSDWEIHVHNEESGELIIRHRNAYTKLEAFQKVLHEMDIIKFISEGFKFTFYCYDSTERKDY